MDDQQEREVARGLREGKTEAWRALYEAYSEPVWHLAVRRMGPHSADVADVVQETFLAAARSAASYDAARGSLWTWLGGIARKHVALHYRKRKRHQRLTADEQFANVDGQDLIGYLEGRLDTPAESLAAAEVADLVRAMLTELPTEYETLLTARYLDDVTVSQLAGHRQCSLTAIRSKLARARRAFRRALLKTATFSTEAPSDSGDSRT